MRNKMYTNAVIELSRKMLENAINCQVKGDFTKMKKIVWGAGESGKNFIELNKDFDFSYIVDTRKHLQGEKLHGLRVYNEDELLKEEKKNTVVFLPTVSHQIWKNILYDKGFNNLIVPLQINSSGLGLPINRSDIYNFVDWLKEYGIKYVYQKHIPADLDLLKLRDFDILVQTKEIPSLINCPLFLKGQNEELISVDIVWSKPINLFGPLEFYSTELTTEILKDKNHIHYQKLIGVKNELLLLMYLYHLILHKGDIKTLEKYSTILRYMKNQLNIEFNLNMEDMFLFIQTSGYPIRRELARQWAEKSNNKFLQKKLVSGYF